jgi:cobalt-precorrin-5B (C1)-methyltransferase
MKTLREGYTTGSCAAAAAKAATLLLCAEKRVDGVDIPLPDRKRLSIPVAGVRKEGVGAVATVRKDAGDDPDVTDKAMISVHVSLRDDGAVRFIAGKGVGTVTKPGLSIPPGEPAINPVPRQMIIEAIREVADCGVDVAVSVENGELLAAKTFNPRLGIEGGISILGTTGIVRPFSLAAIRETVRCSLSVAAAAGVKRPILVPGHIGERAARANFKTLPEQIVEAGNEWGIAMDEAARHPFEALMTLGHPGKLAKLIDDGWDTHSSRSTSAIPTVERFYQELFGAPAEKSPTVEGIFGALDDQRRLRLAGKIAEAVKTAVETRVEGRFIVAVVMIDLAGRILGRAGETRLWN